jgi:hypothetical protein
MQLKSNVVLHKTLKLSVIKHTSFGKESQSYVINIDHNQPVHNDKANQENNRPPSSNGVKPFFGVQPA